VQYHWRVACVRIPRFPIGAVWRHAIATGNGPQEGDSPPASWDEEPLVLVDNERVCAVTAAAARASIGIGMSLPQARARCAELRVLRWDANAIASEVRRASVAFLEASPSVAPARNAPGVWWIGTEGGVHNDLTGREVALASRLLAIARHWHPASRVSIADSCVAAYAATWESDPHRSIRIVAPGSSREYLARVPLGLIPMDAELRMALQTLGFRRAGELAALPPGEVEQRWGEAGLAAWRLARGDDPRRPAALRFETPHSASLELVPSTSNLEPLLFVLRGALERLGAELASDGRAAAAIAVTLTLDDARGPIPTSRPHTVTREVRLTYPVARPTVLFQHCRALLEGWRLPAPVCGFAVAILATAKLVGEQGDILTLSWHDPAAIESLYARLQAELGSETVLRPIPCDEHRPDKAGAWVPATQPVAHEHSTLNPKNAEPAFHRLEPPEEAEVEKLDGVPSVIWWRGQRIRIAYAVGPERLSGNWWQDTYARDYWRCQDAENETELLLVHDFLQRRWLIEGWYD
jgi:protein ImuB